MPESPISLLHFSNSVARGGAEEHILTLLRGLDRNRWRLHFVCTPEVADHVRRDVPPDVNLIPLSLLRPVQAGAMVRLARIIQVCRVEILHSHLFHSSLCASPVGRLCRVPVILETPHVRESWRHGWLKSRFLVDRLAGRFVDCFIAVSEANAQYLRQTKGLPGKKIVVIRNGCDVRQFHPNIPVPVDLKERLGFSPSDPVLVVVGRLEPQKGHVVLLDAMTTVVAAFARARLVCIGDGALRRQLEARARILGIQNSVRFVGYQRDVAGWLALADATVLPSFYEGLPLAAIESLAAGRPVIATAVDGTPEVVIDGRTGFTVPPGDPARLADAICRILNDSHLRGKLGQAGRQLVLERFSHEAQVRQTHELYLRLWRGRVREHREERVEILDQELPRNAGFR